MGAKDQMKITAAALNNDSLPEGRHQDHIVPGLLIIIGKKRRTWYVRYRGAGGKQKTDLLGYFVPNAPPKSDSLGLQEAREKARAVLERVEAGVPVLEAKPAHPLAAGSLCGFDARLLRGAAVTPRMHLALAEWRCGLHGVAGLLRARKTLIVYFAVQVGAVPDDPFGNEIGIVIELVFGIAIRVSVQWCACIMRARLRHGWRPPIGARLLPLVVTNRAEFSI